MTRRAMLLQPAALIRLDDDSSDGGIVVIATPDVLGEEVHAVYESKSVQTRPPIVTFAVVNRYQLGMTEVFAALFHRLNRGTYDIYWGADSVYGNTSKSVTVPWGVVVEVTFTHPILSDTESTVEASASSVATGKPTRIVYPLSGVQRVSR